MKKKETRGGARKGSGRKRMKAKDHRPTLVTTVAHKTLFKIEQYALENKLSRGAAIDALIGVA